MGVARVHIFPLDPRRQWEEGNREKSRNAVQRECRPAKCTRGRGRECAAAKYSAVNPLFGALLCLMSGVANSRHRFAGPAGQMQ
jgi:hypothetical protein